MNANKRQYLILLFCTTLTLNAQTSESIDSIIPLNETVVTANKIDVNRNNVPLSITSISKEQIQSSSESALLPVLSQRVPGLFVTEKGITGFGVSAGSAGMVNIRGVGQGNKVLMLFDGQPQWAGLFGHSLPDTYIASDVEKVEVVRGPASLLYGSNAMGGVVNILTRQHKMQGRQTQARVMYGSYNTQKYMINNGYNIGDLSTFFSINHDRTDGHRDNASFYQTNGFGKIAYSINNNIKTTADISIAQSKGQNPGMVDAPIMDNIMDVFRGTASYAIENNHDKASGAIRLFYNWGKHELNDGYLTDQTPRNYLFNSLDHNYGALLYQTFKLIKDNSFTVGIDYKNWGGHAWNYILETSKKEEIIDKTVNEFASYIIMQQNIADLISLNAGVRYEHNSSFGGEWVPQAGLTYRPFLGNTIRASFSKGFRSPNIRELYMFAPKNPDLRPEQMLSYELSAEQMMFSNKLRAKLTAFYIDGKDMIQVSMETGSPLNINTGEFVNKGFEAELGLKASSRLDIDAHYSYLHTDKPLLAAPKHRFITNASYRIGKFTIDAFVQTIHGLYINTSEEITENYSTLNSKVTYTHKNDDNIFNVFIKGENLTATKYSINEGFPMPKAVAFIGTDITF